MTTLSEHLDAWLDQERAHGRSATHLRATLYGARRWLRWLGETHAIATPDRLRRETLEAWQLHLACRSTRKGVPLKPSSINREVESVRAFLAWLAGRGLVPSSLLAALSYVAQPKLLPTSVLTHAQMRRALATLDGSTPEGIRDRAMLEMLYSSGLRAAELLGLDVRDVDLDNATALVMGKGAKQRVVPIGRTALRHLESYLKGVRPFLLKTNPAQPALWLNGRGERVLYPVLLRRVHEHLKNAGLPATVTPHTFRRSCTTELIRGGANLWHVKELLGHENLDTLRHYAKLTIADLKKTHAKCHPRERDGAP
jgi:site-specific recombinase XerD